MCISMNLQKMTFINDLRQIQTLNVFKWWIITAWYNFQSNLDSSFGALNPHLVSYVCSLICEWFRSITSHWKWRDNQELFYQNLRRLRKSFYNIDISSMIKSIHYLCFCRDMALHYLDTKNELYKIVVS